MFKKEFLYDFIEEGYKGNGEFKLAVSKLIKRMNIAGYIDVAEEIKKIQGRNSRISKALVKDKNDDFKNYHPNIKNKADLLYQGYKHRFINSAILYGSPGTGKTHFVQQFSKHFNLDVISMNLSSILDYRYGESIKKLERFIHTNKDKYQIIFLDEADSIFSKRGNSQDVFETSRIITTMLQLLDEKRNALVIFSTNLITSLDKAIIRRFDLRINFDYDLENSLDILKDFIDRYNIKLNEEEISIVEKNIKTRKRITISDLDVLAKRIAILKLEDVGLRWFSKALEDFFMELNSSLTQEFTSYKGDM